MLKLFFQSLHKLEINLKQSFSLRTKQRPKKKSHSFWWRLNLEKVLPMLIGAVFARARQLYKNPRTNPWNFHKKILIYGWAGKWGFLSRPFWIFWGGHFEFFFASSLWKKQPIHIRYHLFLHYGWFFQNLGKEAVRTFMHTTVPTYVYTAIGSFKNRWLTSIIWQYRLWSFQTRGTKLERFLLKNHAGFFKPKPRDFSLVAG